MFVQYSTILIKFQCLITFNNGLSVPFSAKSDISKISEKFDFPSCNYNSNVIFPIILLLLKGLSIMLIGQCICKHHKLPSYTFLTLLRLISTGQVMLSS